MAKKGFTPEKVVALLREVEVLIGHGKTTPVACRQAGISAVSFYRWRKEYGGPQLDQARRMKDPERENAWLKKIVADLSLEKAMVK